MIKQKNYSDEKRKIIFPGKMIVEVVREAYPPGTRIELIEMDDTQAPPVGTKGTVTGVDDTASILVAWDNGSSLNIIFGKDACRKVCDRIDLPSEEYIHEEKNGRTVTYCTMRQKVLHTIGLKLNGRSNGGRLYIRNGKRFYRPYRNYFYGKDTELDMLVSAGYMCTDNDEKQKAYWFNQVGLNWLGNQIGITIKDEED